MRSEVRKPLVRPIVAIVGRPNVGKSTLFNRLIGRRRALVRDVPGVTRDRLYGTVSFERWQATAIDTGGFDPMSAEPLIEAVRRHVMAAVDEADVVLFVVDARAGVTTLDLEIAQILRRANRPILLVANKVDAGDPGVQTAELHRLGFGEPNSISAEGGRGIGELLERLRASAAPAVTPAALAPPPVRVAIIGRPNVGKSSLVNAMIGADRVLVHEAPGTTRDAVDTTIVYGDRPYVLIDTAGIRRKGRVAEALEKLSVVMALKSLERCEVAVLVLDASDGVTAQDAHIGGYAHGAGRAVVMAVNKWDLAEPHRVRKADAVAEIRDRLPFLDYAPVCFTSALRAEGVAELFDAIAHVAAGARRRVDTAAATRALREAVERRPVSVSGVPLTIQSASQVGGVPPTFAVRVNRPDGVHFSYERYLVKSLRHAFGFEGSPIRLSLRRAAGRPRARPRRTRR